MLSSQNRLSRAKDIEAVHRKGIFFSAETVFIKALKNDKDVSRFAVAVGLKISPKAVERNRLKRLLRAVLRQNLDKIKPGYDFLVGIKKGQSIPDYQFLEKSLLGALKKGQLIK